MINNKAIGQPFLREEDARLVKGEGAFVDDLHLNTLAAHFLRSTVASGKIEKLDIKNALKVEGVKAIFTGEDVKNCGKNAVNALLPNMKLPLFEILPLVNITSLGQPIALIIAENSFQAEQSLEAIELKIDETVAKPEQIFSHIWQKGDCEEAFKAAKYVVEAEIQHARLAPSSLEPRKIIAEFKNNTLKVHLASQSPHRAKSDIARILNMSPHFVHTITNDVGGAFGAKASLSPEEMAVCFAALTLKTAVKWLATRSEEFLSATQGRGALAKGKMALDKKGNILGLKAEFDFPLGYWLPFSAAAPARNAGRILPSAYAIDTIHITAKGTKHNTAPVSIYRGAGRPEATLLIEILMDKASNVLKKCPLAFRTEHIRKAENLELATGEILDTGDFEGLLTKINEHHDFTALFNALKKRRMKGDWVGQGLAFYIEPCGIGFETAEIYLDEQGQIIAASGTNPQGQGQNTAFKQILSTNLNVSMQQITLLQGDSETCPAGIGAVASRSTSIGGSALHLAAEKLKNRIAVEFLAEKEQVTFSEAGASFDNILLSWQELAGRLKYQKFFEKFETKREAWASGLVLCVLSVDKETFKPTIEQLFWLDDAGVMINPLLAKGQLIGGAAQGIGEALMEQLIYENDQLLTGSFMDYAIPRASDMPKIEIESLCSPSPLNPLGAKGVGEAGTIGIPAAIMLAARDALSLKPQEDMHFPLTADKLFGFMQKRTK